MSKVWEIDFYSRPIVDEQQKKIWELLVCDTERKFEFTKVCSGSQANARWLQEALLEALPLWRQQKNLADEVVPEKIRFFRRSMKSIIPRACEALEIPSQPSRRTFAVYQWLSEREQTVYPQHPGYQPMMAAPITFEPTLPKPLPDALLGEGWRLVTLQLSAFAEMDEWDIAFGDKVPLEQLNLPSEAVIPGLLIFSERATPLAGWMSGLELSCLKLEMAPKPQLLLETGLNDRWIIAYLHDKQLVSEIQEFEKTKQAAQQVHFVAVQSSPDSEKFAGFWLMQEMMAA
ncbi:Tab2/Atab2 family RNA-binding protein [Acaryochloris sp. IP29b_bin.137]|uniref:Tab2/Atab2 family RNA-binding protein n=1 Tax=Acaryochloris sp. IP29b_bin.137 TaxID=2969217 RepID=UPI002620F581|nr:Tab2/Atab2 family RNA-binding protein [Acaryochloris sp. IP29b_bin.137]